MAGADASPPIASRAWRSSCSRYATAVTRTPAAGTAIARARSGVVALGVLLAVSCSPSPPAAAPSATPVASPTQSSSAPAPSATPAPTLASLAPEAGWVERARLGSGGPGTSASFRSRGRYRIQLACVGDGTVRAVTSTGNAVSTECAGGGAATEVFTRDSGRLSLTATVSALSGEIEWSVLVSVPGR
jgi:hypothetical protein